MIPEFDEHGYLPPGIHPATMEQIEQRFARESDVREALFESLVWLVDVARRANVLRIVVNGSYVTDVSEPNDVDCVLLVPVDFDMHSDPAQELLAGFPFLSLELVDARAFDEMVEFFGSDRRDVPKGMIEVLP